MPRQPPQDHQPRDRGHPVMVADLHQAKPYSDFGAGSAQGTSLTDVSEEGPCSPAMASGGYPVTVDAAGRVLNPQLWIPRIRISQVGRAAARRGKATAWGSNSTERT
ncbi:hypothetical protein Vafri_10640, partial [Volvox africanus]